MSRPTAAKGSFPYLDHKTVAEIWHKEPSVMLAQLDEISRQRSLTDHESQRLEWLLRKVAA
jgi:hypothetical protein